MKITKDQQKIINLIKTWKGENVFNAVRLNYSQFLGVEVLYSKMLIDMYSDSDNSHSFLEKIELFPIELLFIKHHVICNHLVSRCGEVYIPSKFESKACDYLFKLFSLTGLPPSKDFKITNYKVLENISARELTRQLNVRFSLKNEDCISVQLFPF